VLGYLANVNLSVLTESSLRVDLVTVGVLHAEQEASRGSIQRRSDTELLLVCVLDVLESQASHGHARMFEFLIEVFVEGA
jgi:hypothetical protein